MSAKIRVLLFALVLVAAMIGEGESFFGNGGGVGTGKRSTLKQDEDRAKDAALRDLRLAREDEMMHIRGKELCEVAKREC